MTSIGRQQSNPFSTGEGGPSFEIRVQSAFAVTLLTGGVAPCLPGWPITNIKLQGRYAGFSTDDCVTVVQEPGTGRQAKLLAQIKHSVNVTDSDENLAEVICAAWKDFNNPQAFHEGSDAIALITGPLSATDRDHVRPLLEWARHCANADEFISKVNNAGFSSERKRQKLRVMTTHLRHANGDTDVPDDALWRFLKSFHLIGYDLDVPSGSTSSLLRTLLSLSCPGEQPDAVLAQVVTFVQSANQAGGTITLDTIPENVRSCFKTGLSRDWEMDLQRLRAHGELILSGIRTDISDVHIERRDLLCQLLALSEQSSFVLVSGERGCGKSGIVREFAESISRHSPVFFLRTEDLNRSHLDHVFSAMGMRSSLSEVAAGFAILPRRYLIIESLERLLELENRGAFADLLRFLKADPGWTVIASAREYAYQALTFHYLSPSGVNLSTFTVPEFTDAELDALCERIPALRPLADNPAIRGLLRNPFYGDLAARVVTAGGQLSGCDGEQEFRAAVWAHVIAKEEERTNGLPIRRRQVFVGVAVKRARAMSYGVPQDEFDPDALLALEADHLVQREYGLVGPAHDVLEDWALDAFIEDAFQRNRGRIADFLAEVGLEPSMNRAFRLWLHRRLRTEDDTGELVVGVLSNSELQTHWHDGVIAAVLMGDNPLQFLRTLRDRLFENNNALLKRFCFVLRIACKAPNHALMRQLASSRDPSESTAATYLYMQPYGGGWDAIVQFLHENRDRIGADLVPDVALVLEEWASAINIYRELPPLAREAGLLSLGSLELWKDVYGAEQIIKRILSVVFKTAGTIERELAATLERDVFAEVDPPGRRELPYVRHLLSMALVGVEGAFLCRWVPDIIVRFASRTWLAQDGDGDRDMGPPIDVEPCFGLRSHNDGTDFFPASGVKGPFAQLLRWHARKGLDFIIGLCNKAADKYAHSTLDAALDRVWHVFTDEVNVPQVELILNDGTRVKQYASERLWSGYRGTAVLPYLLQSALMALENWLIEVMECPYKQETIEWIVDHILRNSNSVMPTAVVASVAAGFPEKMGKSALPLLRVPELYDLDLIRSVKESPAFRVGRTPDPFWQMYDEERKAANGRPWRSERLETLAVRLQFTDLRNELFKILDEFQANVPGSGADGERETPWRFRLHRMDMRTVEPVADENNNRIVFVPKEIEPDLQEIQDQAQNDQSVLNRFSALFLWAEANLEHRPPEREYFANWQAALQEGKELPELLKNRDFTPLSVMHYGGAVKAAAVIFRDHRADMSEEDLEWSTVLLVEAVLANADVQDTISGHDSTGMDGAPAAARVLPILLDFADNDERRHVVRSVIATALTHGNASVRKSLATGIKAHLWQRDAQFAQACVNGAIEFARLYLEAVRSRSCGVWEAPPQQSDSPPEPEPWLRDLRERIANCEVNADPDSISFDSHSAWHIIQPCLIIPAASAVPEHISLLKRLLRLILVNEEQANRRNHPDTHVDRLPVDLAIEFPRLIADHAVGAPHEKSDALVRLIVDHCDRAPDFVGSFLVYLTGLTDKCGDYARYWDIWQALASEMQGVAAQLAAHDPEYARCDDRSKLIAKMLFADIPWQQVELESALLRPGVEPVLAFVRAAGAYSVVFESMARLLFYFPAVFMPEGLMLLADHQNEVGGTTLVASENAVFFLERVMQNLLVLNPNPISIPETVRAASLDLLNAMIEMGSSSAYFLRDHLLRLPRQR